MTAPLAVCVLYVEQDKVLAVARRGSTTEFGLPGGKVEPEEDWEAAAIREMVEETQATPLGLKLLFRGEDSSGYDCLTYLAPEIRGVPSQGDAGPVAFVSWEALLSGPFGDYLATVRQSWLASTPFGVRG